VLYKQANHAGPEVLAEHGKVQPRNVHETTRAIEAPFQHDSVQLRVELRELPYRGIGDDRRA